jgi:intracellular multiplication protein IcmO
VAKEIRGLESKHEQRGQQLLRDTRSLGEKYFDFVKNAQATALTLVCMAVATLLIPGLIDVLLAYGIFIFLVCIFQKPKLPFRMPLRSKLPDYNDLQPGSEKPNTARGIAFFGNERGTDKELWFSNDDMRTHALIFGSTGSGKTEALVSIAFNAFIQGSGVIYVDGKGDTSLFAKMFAMARKMGREDDLLLINFMTGARDIIGPQKSRISNTMNPFSRGSSSMLSELVVSLMDASGGSGDGDMWKGRAIAFVQALMKILVYMRDQGHILLDANSIRNYFLLPKLESMVIDAEFPINESYSVPIKDIPELVIEPIKNYVINLPGYDKNKKHKQGSEVLEQHGFITMQLTRVFSSLADTYGHILRTNIAEVDFKDVVLNRRILVVLLPALEKSPEELANLGKLVVASLKAMMAAGLGEEVEGTYQEVIERKPTNAPTPFLCILDEYGYYAVPGFAVVPAQARSLGFSAIFAGQDLPAFQKASKEEAASIGANTNIKICMKLEDPTETWEFFQKTASETYVTQTGGFQTNANSLTNSYLDSKSAQVERRQRIELLDLKDQDPGEAHIFFKSSIVRARLFFANPPKVARLKLNQLLKVGTLPEKELINIADRLSAFENAINNPSILTTIPTGTEEELHFVMDAMMSNHSHHSLQDQSLLTFAAYYLHENHVEELEEEEFEVPMDVENESNVEHVMDLFTQPAVNVDPNDPFAVLHASAISMSLLNKRDVLANLERIERYLGTTKSKASPAALKVVKDARAATTYPQTAPPHYEAADVVAAINDVIKALGGSTEEGGSILDDLDFGDLPGLPEIE